MSLYNAEGEQVGESIGRVRESEIGAKASNYVVRCISECSAAASFANPGRMHHPVRLRIGRPRVFGRCPRILVHPACWDVGELARRRVQMSLG